MRWCGPPARGGFRRQNRHTSLAINGHHQTSSTPVKSAQIHRFSTALSGYVRLKIYPQPVRSAGFPWLPPDFVLYNSVHHYPSPADLNDFHRSFQSQKPLETARIRRFWPDLAIQKTVQDRPTPPVVNGFFYQLSLIYNYAQDYIFS
ncbi:hypothetical protein C8F04DRAFT_1229205 [Mycena alexandri]|uniref:Uncharacterized protein n=1 Tax=Mycena alexandri TaxID=1745969 RepID=A0AAD6XBE9_9AGAR|nr:hypothetical protein C8F04DRAFT_1229205 [Mycena alexandri]